MRFNDIAMRHLSKSARPQKEGSLVYHPPKDSPKTRWFRLVNNLLFYYKQGEVDCQGDPEPLGLLVLDQYKVLLRKSSTPPCFVILFQGEETGRRHVFQCPTVIQCEEWAATLRSCNYDNLRQQFMDLSLQVQAATGRDCVPELRSRLLEQKPRGAAVTVPGCGGRRTAGTGLPSQEEVPRKPLDGPSISRPRPVPSKTQISAGKLGEISYPKEEVKERKRDKLRMLNGKRHKVQEGVKLKSRFYAPVGEAVPDAMGAGVPASQVTCRPHVPNVPAPHGRGAPLISRPSDGWDFKDLLPEHLRQADKQTALSDKLSGVHINSTSCSSNQGAPPAQDLISFDWDGAVNSTPGVAEKDCAASVQRPRPVTVDGRVGAPLQGWDIFE